MPYDVLRILDANANRAREALRVMEEAARFLLDDAELCKQCKNARHQLAQVCGEIVGLELHRNTPGDVGTQISTDAESTRDGVREVVIAAGKRLSEALRSMEEYLKTLPPRATRHAAGIALAKQIEQLRYTSYRLEQQLHQRLGSIMRKQFKLCVLLSESLCTQHDWFDVARQAIEGGADCLQLREKSLASGELLERAIRLVSLVGEADVGVIVNDRPDIAILAGASGVHLGQTDMPCEAVRKLVGPEMLIGVSTSRLDEAKQAYREGADYCGVGPVFSTTTKHKDVIVGSAYLRAYLTWNKLPHFAIGGIEPGNISELAAVGVQGIAVSSCVCGAKKPVDVCRRLVQAITRPSGH